MEDIADEDTQKIEDEDGADFAEDREAAAEPDASEHPVRAAAPMAALSMTAVMTA